MLFWRALARLPGCLRWVPTRPDTSVGRILKKTAVRAVTFHLLGNGCCVLLCSCVVWYSFFFWMCVCILHKEGKEVRNTTYISLVLAVVPRDPFVAFWGFSFAPVTASCRFISKVNKQKSFRQWSASLLEEKLREKHVGATDPMPECSWFWVASVAVQLPREPRSHGLCLCSTEQISSCKAEMFVLVFLLSWYAQHLFFCRSFLWANTRAHPHWGCSCDSKTWSEKQWVVMSWHACTYWFKYSKCHIPYVLRTRTLCFQAKNPQEKKTLQLTSIFHWNLAICTKFFFNQKIPVAICQSCLELWLFFSVLEKNSLCSKLGLKICPGSESVLRYAWVSTSTLMPHRSKHSSFGRKRRKS